MPASRWHDWYGAAESAFDNLAATGGPVVTIGFSTGATIALRLATRRPVSRQILLAPFLAIRYSGFIPVRPVTYLRRLAKLMPDVPRRPPALRHRAMRRRIAAATHFRTFSLLSALSALELIDDVKPLVSKIMIPTLIIQGKRDTVVEPLDASWLLRHLGSENKRLMVLPRSDHLVALDHESEQAIDATLAFVLGD
jgi:carboxylesterase